MRVSEVPTYMPNVANTGGWKAQLRSFPARCRLSAIRDWCNSTRGPHTRHTSAIGIGDAHSTRMAASETGHSMTRPPHCVRSLVRKSLAPDHPSGQTQEPARHDPQVPPIVRKPL